jgi:hypothetical protein
MEVLAENQRVLSMIASHWPTARYERRAAYVTVHTELPQHEEERPGAEPVSASPVSASPVSASLVSASLVSAGPVSASPVSAGSVGEGPVNAGRTRPGQGRHYGGPDGG